MDQGTYLEIEDKQNCHFYMRLSALTCSIILPSIIKIFLTIAKICFLHFNNQSFLSENLVKSSNFELRKRLFMCYYFLQRFCLHDIKAANTTYLVQFDTISSGLDFPGEI